MIFFSSSDDKSKDNSLEKVNEENQINYELQLLIERKFCYKNIKIY
jgi:hypothetical protein